MSITNGERLVTKQDLADFYNEIRPYMGGLVTSKAGFTPIGTIISVMGTTAPVNYLACDGTVYNIADYTELANYFNEQFGSKNFFGGNGTTTFAVPDLRGEFLRGTGTNSHTNQGSGASVGVHQDATELSNVQIGSSSYPQVQFTGQNDWGSIHKSGADTGIIQNGSLDPITSTSLRGTYNQSVDTSDRNIWIGFTTKPTNTSVLYCIATKNFYIDPTLDYSTDEKVVGTWITGEPLYQKTFVGKTPTAINTSENFVLFKNGNIFENIIVCNSFATDGASTPTYIQSNAEMHGWRVWANPTGIRQRLTSDGASYLNCDAYVTIQYTKTTGT